MDKKLNITYRNVSDLIPYINNARTHSETQVAQIAASIKEFGFNNPILLDGENGVIAGHGRIEAAKKLGLDVVPTIELEHLSPAQRKAYIIADNKLALNAGWDEDILKLEIETLTESELDIELLGFNEQELSAIMLEVEQGETDPYAEWDGMPEFDGSTPWARKVVVNFKTEDDAAAFFALIGQEYTDKTKSIWFPEQERRDLESMRFVDGEENGGEDVQE